MIKQPVALVLDDDEFFRKMIQKVLLRLGVGVKTVNSIEEFRTQLDFVKPELCLIDLNLGQQSGIAIIEELRAEKNKVPIIVVSGSSDPQIVSHALEVGANDFILKPLDRALLAAKLGQFVRTEEIEDQEKYLSSEKGEFDTRISLDAEIIAIDELGITFQTPHLVPKGAVVKLASDFLQKFGANECLICASTTKLVPESGHYEIYAEFEEANAAFMQGLRAWLAGVSQSA